MVNIEWGAEVGRLFFDDVHGPIRMSLSTAIPDQPARKDFRSTPGLVEILAVGHGRGLNSMRASRTAIGDRLRYVNHTIEMRDDVEMLRIVQADPTTGIEACVRIQRQLGSNAFRFCTELVHRGSEPILLQQVTTLTLTGLTERVGSAEVLDLWQARNEWCGESRWFSAELAGVGGIVDINPRMHGHFARGWIGNSGQSTWSTEHFLPMAALRNRETGCTLGWTIEHNGPWRWEIETLFDEKEALALALLGPTDLDHSCLVKLNPGETYETVPASLAISAHGLEGLAGEMTQHRRNSVRFKSSARRYPLIFNDYMNALMGDPTTDKLMPLIDAAAAAGAQYFCIDAGWYDDGWNWWPSVGAWQPSQRRFAKGGLVRVLDYIRAKGLKPGLWIEPEVIGVQSKLAESLPAEAFMTRGGTRIVEHDRYFLDMRNDVARGYLDSVFDRLIGELGVEYFKWDYNVTPGTGPDYGADSSGHGLLDHSRALLRWVDSLRTRHPGVVFEACSSGAQRMDDATLSYYDLQSTSDQQDYRLYAPIAAAAPMMIPFERAGNWAYPQPDWDLEQTAFTLVTGLSGRLYLSGHLNELGLEQVALVHEATSVYERVMEHHRRALPSWPLGLPAWDDEMVAVASVTGESMLLFVWYRGPAAADMDVPLADFMGRDVELECVFPAQLAEWKPCWDPRRAVLSLSPRGEGARIFEIKAAGGQSAQESQVLEG